MNQFKDSFINFWLKHLDQFMLEVPSVEEKLPKIRTVPNILKRKRSKETDFPRSLTSTSATRNNIAMKKKIFNPIRNELLMWENYHLAPPVMLNIDIDDELGETQSNETELNLSKCSPMWCPTNSESYANEHIIEIIETAAVDSPISEITNSIYSEFVQPEFQEFQREMNLSINEDENIDVKTKIELGKFDCHASNDHLQASKQKDHFDEVIKDSWSKFECLTCGKIHNSQSDLNTHLKMKHHHITKKSPKSVISSTCPGCLKIFKTYSGYDRHMTRCNIMTQFKGEKNL